jgi:putative ABC transport system permease protein
MLLMTVFGAAALLLAAIGIYGLIAFAARQRTHEIGIRMALGAGRASVLGLVVSGGLRIVGLGVALGLAGSLVLGRLLRSWLFEVTAHDPLVFAANAGLLLTVAAVASALPGHRAARVDPAVTLRAD